MANQLNLADRNRSDGLNQPQSTRSIDHSRQYVHTTVVVEQPMNSHGGMRLSAAPGNQTFQVVDYATEEIHESLVHTEQGAILDVHLVKLGSRGNAWRVVAVVSGEQ